MEPFTYIIDGGWRVNLRQPTLSKKTPKHNKTTGETMSKSDPVREQLVKLIDERKADLEAHKVNNEHVLEYWMSIADRVSGYSKERTKLREKFYEARNLLEEYDEKHEEK